MALLDDFHDDYEGLQVLLKFHRQMEVFSQNLSHYVANGN